MKRQSQLAAWMKKWRHRNGDHKAVCRIGKGSRSRRSDGLHHLTIEQLEGRRLLASLTGEVPVLLNDMNPGSKSSSIYEIVTVGDRSFFVNNYTELWSTQGRAGDPVMIADFKKEDSSVWINELAEHSGKLVFRVITDPPFSAEVEEFFSYDPRTELLQSWMTLDSTQHAGYSYPDFFVSTGNELYFSINDQDTGSELWKANRDLSSTTRVKSLGPLTYVAAMQTSGPHLVFTGDNLEAWSTDGTTEGTQEIRDVTAAVEKPFEYAGADDLYGGELGALATADFDSDGAMDFAVPGKILFGDGQGGVLRRQSYGDLSLDFNSIDLVGIQVIDIDKDGDQDVAVALSGEFDQLQVFRNDGLGQLTLDIQLDVPGISRALATGSVDEIPGDDLLLAIGNAILRLIPGDNPGLETVAIATHQVQIDQLLAKDFDGDGLLDLVTSESNRQWYERKSLVTIFKQTSLGSFDEQTRSFLSDDYQVNLFVNELALADWNGDGLKDLIVGQSGGNYYYFGSSRFGIVLQTPSGFDGPVSWISLPGRMAGLHVAPQSNNSDGFLLIGVESPNQWLVYPFDGNAPSESTPIGLAMDQVPSSIATGDFNGDGLTDLAMGDWDSRIITYTNFSAGSFGIYPSKPVTGEVVSSVAFRNPGDAQDTILSLSHILGATQINRRGSLNDVPGAPAGYVPEIALAGKATKVLAQSLQGGPANDLLLLFPEGRYISIFEDGSYLRDQRINLGSGAADMVPGDWNGDGLWDLAVSYPEVHRIVIYQQSVLGSFSPSIIRDLPGGGWQLISVDADGDGDQDLVTPDGLGNQLLILPAVSGGFAATQSVSIPGGPQWIQFADMDHVGLLDLVVTTEDLGMIVALRDAAGNVYASHREEMPFTALDLDLADISGDGWIDVIVTPSTGSQALVYYGAIDGEVGYAIPQWIGVGARQLVVGTVEEDMLPGLFAALQTLPGQDADQSSFGYMVEMRPNALATPIESYLSFVPRDTSVETSYFLSYVEDDYYYAKPSFHLPGDYASRKVALWRTDGTSHGTQMIYDFQKNEPYYWFAGPDFLIGAVYNSTTGESELWTSDGTTEGTQFIRSFPDFGGYEPSSYVALNGKIYFPAATEDEGSEIWETDGTLEGTKLFYEFIPGSKSGLPYYEAEFLKTPSGFYVTATTEEHGEELWFSDGTVEGTVLAADVEPGPDSSSPQSLHWTGSTVIFVASTSAFGDEPWALGSVQYDFGDAPDSYGTLVASDGPRHRLGSGLYLGYAVDTESDGAPGSLANKDDTSGIADEDAANTSVRLVLGVMNNVTLVASGLGFLDLWLDLDQDGNFSPDEHFTQGESVLMEPGENTFQWMLPAGTLPGITYARLRFSATGGLLPTGEAMTGEVEDHRVVVRSSSQSDWQNPRDPYDTNYSGDIKPSDALVVINYLNSVGQGLLPPNPGIPPFWYDVNGDGSATPLDALRVINYLNLAGAGGEGESSIASMLLVTSDSDLAWPFASAELIGGPSDFDDSSPWDDLEIVSEGIIEEVVLGGAEDTSWELSGPVDDRAYSTATETVDQVMSDAELEAILMATPPLQTQLSSFWMELRKRMAGRI